MTAYQKEIREMGNERLVERFDFVISQLVKQENFRRGGVTKKAEKEYNDVKNEILRRMGE